MLSHPTGPLQGFLRCEDGVARVSRVSTRRDPAPPAGFRGSRFGSARFRWKWTEVAFFPQSRRGPALRLSSARFMERRSPELVLGDLKARTYLGRGLLSVVSKFRPFKGVMQNSRMSKLRLPPCRIVLAVHISFRAKTRDLGVGHGVMRILRCPVVLPPKSKGNLLCVTLVGWWSWEPLSCALERFLGNACAWCLATRCPWPDCLGSALAWFRAALDAVVTL